MSMDLTGITNKNEYYTNHYLSTLFEENADEVIKRWNAEAKESEEARTPWAMLRADARRYYVVHDRFTRSSVNLQTLYSIKTMADLYLESLGYPEAKPEIISIDDSLSVPVYLEMAKSNGAPALWILLAASDEADAGILDSHVFNGNDVTEDSSGALYSGIFSDISNEDLATRIFFSTTEPPRFIMLIGANQIALLDRNKWNEKRYLQFELEEIFSRLENTTLQAMAVLLHRESLCPDDGKNLLDELDEQSQKHAAGVSQDLKYALRECIEILGNEVLYDMKHRLGRDLEADPVDAGQLTLECLRYMYRMLFVLFIEARPELGYAPIKSQSYYSTYSLESLRDIADDVRDDINEVGNGYYLHDTLAKLYELIYDGYPKTEEELKEVAGSESLHDMFIIAPLKAHIFDPEYTQMITEAKLRNSCMLQIIDLMSLTRATGKKGDRRGRISYANLGINQMGAVYEALLSYRGFIAEQDLYEVKKAGDSFNELEVGYFVPESELDQYTEDERVRYESGEKKGQLRMYKKGTFIYRLAGREREKSASYYTPEVLTKCLVKYALKELLEDKTADEILELTICEPAMGSAAFLNETINQLAEAYITRKEKEIGGTIGYEKRFDELQKVKMYIADHNVYGIDLNSVAVELAEVSLWLNTIYEGGYVPWFGNQLVNGNSLIGARRQVYRIENAQATSKGMRWYEMEPERLPFGTERAGKKGKITRGQIYHFLLGDPGMCNYSDKIIKSLDTDNIKKMVNWNKKFTQPITDDEATTLLRLSDVIDELWERQIKLREEVRTRTWDSLSIFGHDDVIEDSHTTIREKDEIFQELYKSEHMQNAGPYARLKFAMDYWCSLWFWPIDKADLLPSRSEFLFDMSLILEGTTQSVVVTNSDYEKKQTRGQLSLFPSEMQVLEQEILDLYENMGEVDIPALRQQNPRLNLAAEIADENKFMHWELEFADLFARHGGFDLIIGNPPWIKMEWKEQGVLADQNPIFAVKKLSATETAKSRNLILANNKIRCLYSSEYENITGQQDFFNARQNYYILKGQQTNLYKCFLPQAWNFNDNTGISAFIHPEGVYDDPKGGRLREEIYKRLRRHFVFTNERRLFPEVDHHTQFSLNIYGAPQLPAFDTISDLFDVSSIEQCYNGDPSAPVPGIKDENGEWSVVGHPDRMIHVTKKELSIFAKLFEGSKEWRQARLPVLHVRQFVDVLECFANQSISLFDIEREICGAEMWHETNAQKNGTIERFIHFPESTFDAILSGPHIGISNPLFKSSREVCILNSDYDVIDLTNIPKNYIQRCNYRPACDQQEYISRAPTTCWGEKDLDNYRILMRNMFNQSGERTLIPAIIFPHAGHIHAVYELGFKDHAKLPLVEGLMSSVPFDFYIKITGKGSGGMGVLKGLPIPDSKFDKRIILNSLLLNCLTSMYSELWSENWNNEWVNNAWAKVDHRLNPEKFYNLTDKWTYQTPFRSDYERRQALIELDVLTAMALGMTLEQLKAIYRIQFPVLLSYESDTWYDANGRIVFTNNRSLTEIGFDRPTWENQIKGAPAGERFCRTITDDTLPGGAIERTIEYVAPFDRCDREEDYETAWRFFEEQFNQENNGGDKEK